MGGRRILSVKWWVLLAMSLLAWYFPRALSEETIHSVTNLSHSCPPNKNVVIRNAYFHKGGEEFSLQLLRMIYNLLDTNNATVREMVVRKLKEKKNYTITYECLGRSNMRNGCQKDTERQEREPPKPVDAVAIFPWELQGPCYTKCTAVPKVQEGDKILIESHCLLSENSTAKIEYRVEDDDETLKSWASFRTQRFTQDRQSKRVSKIYLRFSIRDSAEVSRMWLKVNGTSMTVTCEKDETGMGDATEISASPLDRTTGAHPQPSTGTSMTVICDKDETRMWDVTEITASPLDRTTGVPGPHPQPPTDNMLPYIIPSVLCVAAIIILLVVFIAKKREINRQGDEADQLLSCVSSASTDLGHAPPGETVHASASASGHVTGSGSEEDRRYGTLDHHHRGTRQTRGGRWGNKEEDDYHHVRLLPPPPPPSEKDEGEDGYDRFQRRTGRQVVVDNPYHHPLEN